MLKHLVTIVAVLLLSACGGGKQLQLQNSLITHDPLSPRSQQGKFHYAQAVMLEKRGSMAAAVQQRIFLEPNLFSKAERYKNALAIWKDLQQLSPSSLQLLLNNARNGVLQGWLRLGLIFKQYDLDSQQLSRRLLRWKQRYPGHSGGLILPEQQLESSNISKIGLLLPNSGPYAKAATAIKHAVFASFYQDKRNIKPEIKYYSTGDGNSSQQTLNAYTSAIGDGVDFIIGPLSKKEVNTIVTNGNSAVPVLTLNTVYNSSDVVDNVYQFGLPAENEVLLISTFAHYKGYKKALIIAANSGYGKNLTDVLSKQWRDLGGTIIATEFFKDKKYSKYVQDLLEISNSKQRAKSLRQILTEKFHFNSRRRKDFDVIFLLANSKSAKQLKPLLDFHYAKNIPVYATSSIYNGSLNNHKNKDLNGIYFCDMPWILENSSNIKNYRQSIATLSPTEFNRYPRYFALGIDAYNLATKLPQLLQLPNLGVPGFTGLLTLNSKQQIERQLNFAVFRNGLPRLVRSR